MYNVITPTLPGTFVCQNMIVVGNMVYEATGKGDLMGFLSCVLLRLYGGGGHVASVMQASDPRQ